MENRELEAARRTKLSDALRNREVWLLAFVYFGLNTCAYGIALWLPSLIRSLSQMSTLRIGVASAIPNVAAVVAMVAVGKHSDKTGERRWHTTIPALAGAGALAVGAYSGNSVLLVAAMSVALAGVFAMDGPFWATSTSLLSGTAAAAGIALINAIGNLGGFFGPYTIGWVRNATGGFGGGLLAAAATLAVSGCLAIGVRKK